MASISLRNIEKIYEGNIAAVKDFDLEIADKEFVVLVGPSGCGKSTMLRMIAGLESITKGQIFIDDRLINDVPPKDRDIAMVFQNYALYPHMTVYENMAFSMRLKRKSQRYIDRKVRAAADLLDIAPLLDRIPKTLSGGQRQRVAIGRAIVRSPKVFLMDEPLSNLDAKLRNQMRVEMLKLRRSIDATFVYVTHDQTEAMTLGDRIVVMKDGMIQQVGTPGEIFETPANLFVAQFIGAPQTNIFDAELRRNDMGISLYFAGCTLPLCERTRQSLMRRGFFTQPVKLGIRPEHMKIAASAASPAIVAEIGVSEHMGNMVQLHLRMGGNEAVIAISTADVTEEYQNGFPYGQLVHIALQTDKIMLFDPVSGDNLIREDAQAVERM